MDLFRHIDAERASGRPPRASLLQRALARWIDLVFYGAVGICIIFAYGAAFDADASEFSPRRDRDCAARRFGRDQNCYSMPPTGFVEVQGDVRRVAVATFGALVTAEFLLLAIIGGSIGQFVTGVRPSLSRTHTRAGPFRATVRALPFLAGLVLALDLWGTSLTYGVGGLALLASLALTVWISDDRRGWHDRLTGTEALSAHVRGNAVPG